MVKLSRFTRKTAGAVALTLALIGGLSFNNFNTLLIHAASTGTVNTSALNVRSGPSTDYGRITTISKGTKLTIISKEGDWYKVEVGGKTGYVAAQYVDVNGEQTENATGKTGTVNVSVLNIRSGASTETRCIGSLRSGTKVSILATEGKWYKIQTGGVTGYVFAQYVTVSDSNSDSNAGDSQQENVEGKSGICNVDALNIRKGVGTSTAVVGLLRKDDKVTVLGKEGDWYKIKHGNVTGYVFAEYVTVGSDNSSSENNENNKPATPDASGKNGKCDVSALNVRSKATTKSSVIGSLSKNTVVEIIGTEGEWYKINAVLNGRTVTGYVFAEYIKLTDEKPSNPPAGGEENNNTSTENQGKKGKCNTYALNVRKGAGTGYAIIGSLSKDETVTIQETKSGWHKVTADNKKLTGYVSAEYITITGNGESQKPEEKPQDDTYTEVNEPVWATAGVNIRKGPGTNYDVIGSLVKNGSVTRVGVGSNGWSKIKYGSVTGYIKSEYLTATNPNPGASEVTGEAVVKFALQFEGNPYVWGGNDLNTGVDCSGFTQQVYLNFGIQLNRTADAQRSNGRSVSLSEVKPGDLVFYGSGGYAGHVGLYIGDGKIIHASTPATGIIISNMNYRTPMQINRIIE